MNVPAVLFLDFDNTLLDASRLGEAIEQTCAAVAPGLGIEPRALAAANEAAFAAYWPSAEAEWQLGKLSGASLSRDVWDRALFTCGVSSSEALDRLVKAHTAFSRDALQLFEDVPRFLERVADRVVLGLISNGGGDTQRERLGWFDLDRYFHAVVLSAEVGLLKPDPAIFHLALKELGVSGGPIWHVGDSLRLDVAGAKAAGINAVWLNRRSTVLRQDDPQPDLEVASLDALVEHLGL